MCLVNARHPGKACRHLQNTNLVFVSVLTTSLNTPTSSTNTLSGSKSARASLSVCHTSAKLLTSKLVYATRTYAKTLPSQTVTRAGAFLSLSVIGTGRSVGQRSATYHVAHASRTFTSSRKKRVTARGRGTSGRPTPGGDSEGLELVDPAVSTRASAQLATDYSATHGCPSTCSVEGHHPHTAAADTPSW